MALSLSWAFMALSQLPWGPFMTLFLTGMAAWGPVMVLRYCLPRTQARDWGRGGRASAQACWERIKMHVYSTSSSLIHMYCIQ